MKATAATLDEIRQQIGETADWDETDERVVTRDLTYADGRSVEIVVRKREWRYDLDDGGDAVARRARWVRRTAGSSWPRASPPSRGST